MATWTTRAHFRGTDDSSWDSPALSSSPRGSSPASSTPPSTPSPWSEDTDFFSNTHQADEGDAMDDSGFQDYMEVQLGVTGEMSVVERLQYLLDTGQFSDVNVRVGQGNNVAVFKAHRLLLATASQPLYKLVYQVNPHPGPNDITTIRVTDMKPSDFQHILRYIYTDNIDCKNISVAFELLRASRKWGLAGLGIKSLTFLEEFIDNFVPTTEESKSNLFDLLVLSEDTLRDTSEKCWEILFKNADILIPCEGYLKLDKKMVRKIICNKELKIENQLKLFEAIRDWGLRYVTEHKLTLAHLGDVVEELIKVVDFDKIPDCDFLNTVLTSECLGKAEVIAFFMTHGLEIPRNLDFNNNKQLPFWMCLCATSDQQDKCSRTGSTKPSSFKQQSNLSTVNEALSKICSLTQNGSVLEFNKVCRFRKGYRCPQKEINQEHELRFRVDKNIKLLGVGFGFLFSPTDMGINVHCQGPWETRQWSDISQAYCRVAGDKQETADVRLMFLQPVRIEARQCYKVLVKTVRMSQGSSEVELWGGTGGLFCVETEDAEFHFIKAAVDPTKSVEESDGDTKPGVITELLYQLDTEESEETTNASQRRRRPDLQEEEPNNMQSNPWRHSHRPDILRVPETPVQRKRSPPSDDYKTPEAPPLSRRRESSDIGRKTSEEYMPTSFSTNRWRTARRKEEEESERKKSVEEYMPSSFSTNRWRTAKPKEEETERKKSVEEYKPSSYSTNQRWRTTTTTRAKEDDKVESRKTSTEDKWRPRPSQEEKKDTPFGSRVFTKAEEATSSAGHPFLRRRESKDSTDIPFYMRSRTTAQQDENKGTAAGALGRSRYGAGTATTTAGESRSSRFLRTDGSSSFTSTRPTGSSSLLSSRYGRESSLTRPRESSISRFGSGSSSYLGRYDNADSPSSVSSGRDTNKLSASSSDSRYTSLAGKYGTDTTVGRTTNIDSVASSSRYGRDVTPSSSSRYGRDTTPSSTRYNTDSTTKPNRYGTDSSTSKYGTEAESGAGSRYSSPARHIHRYGASTTGSGSDLTALGGRSGQGQRRYGSSATGSAGNLGALSTRTSGSGVGSVGTGVGSSSRYGSSTATSLSSRYSSPASTGVSLASRSKASDLIASLSSKYASALSSASNKFGTGRCYTTPAPTRVTGRGAGLSSYTPSNKYVASPSSGGLSSSKYSTAGRYTSPAPSASSNR